ncbi:MAG: hypothetical protein H6636_02120 [Anaerolineales bacterium]|nr:hypothetical protein [Anaerolineales bacterium]
MSIYDYRDKPAYRIDRTEPHYAKNRHILKWWNSRLDELLKTQISLWQWVWYWTITDEILKSTPSDVIENWKNTDPLCSKYAWYNILMYFAIARADELGFTKSIRAPIKKTCPLCNNEFVEDSLPMSLVAIQGIERLDFCAPCLSETFFQGIGSVTMPKENILRYLQGLANLLGRVPPQNFWSWDDRLVEYEYR